MPRKNKSSRGATRVSRGRGRGGIKETSPPPSPRSPTPPPIDTAPVESSQENDIIEDTIEDTIEDISSIGSSRDASPVHVSTAKKPKTTSDLTTEEEDIMAEWVQENECLFNKKLNSYKNSQKKNQLWNDKAVEMGKTSSMLVTWYRSLRSRYGRLMKKKSGQGAAELTERDEWVLTRFSFLKNHIYEVNRRTVVSIKAKVASAAGNVDDIYGSLDLDEDSQDNTSAEVSVAPSLAPRPKKSGRRSTEEEDAVLAGINERGKKTIELQQKMLEALQPQSQRATERTMYADWTKTVIEDLDPSLWRRFQVEHSQILHKYLGMNDDIRYAANQPPPAFLQHQQQIPQNFQMPPQPLQSHSTVWQHPPPENQTGNTIVADWTQRQIQPLEYTTLQPRSMLNPQGNNINRNSPSATITQSDYNYNLRAFPEANDNSQFSGAAVERIETGVRIRTKLPIHVQSNTVVSKLMGPG